MKFTILELIIITLIALPTFLAWALGLSWVLDKWLKSKGIDLGVNK